MESIGSTVWFLAFLVQYGALIVATGLMISLVVMTLYELIRNRVSKSRIPTPKAVQESSEGSVAISH